MAGPHVIVIGGGGTGTAVAWDLSLRGARVTLLERGELTSGTTGRHHGQLHCGARYAVQDRRIGRECMQESEILRRIAGGSIEFNYGLFAALSAEDEAYAGTFLSAVFLIGAGLLVFEYFGGRSKRTGVELTTIFTEIPPD